MIDIYIFLSNATFQPRYFLLEEIAREVARVSVTSDIFPCYFHRVPFIIPAESFRPINYTRQFVVMLIHNVYTMYNHYAPTAATYFTQSCIAISDLYMIYGVL